MGRLVRPGGVLAITCVSPAGLLADLCRQLLRPALLERAGSFESQVALGARVIEPHLATLGQSTRSAADWVIDNVLHDWLPAEEPLFTPALSARALAPLGFDMLGSSPRIGQDERWFKHIGPDSEPYSDRFLAQFEHLIPAQLDHRVGTDERVADPTDVETLLNELVRLRHDIITANSYERLPEFLENLTRLGSRLPSGSVETVRAIEDFCDPNGMLAVADGAPFPEWPHFSAWWGRGVVHLSFWRGPDTHRD